MPKRISKLKSSVKKPNTPSIGNYLERIEKEVETNQSKVSLVLGALIVLVIGILIFNYFNKNRASLGPAQQTKAEQSTSPNQLPGKYTVKEGDTLFAVADKYYQDGYKYSDIAKANNITDPNQLEPGQELEIPKLEAQPQTSASPEPSQANPQDQNTTSGTLGTGGGNQTIWGPRIEGDKYTVVEDDWLSKIAGRAYGDVMAFEKIAQANNITDPNQIEPGTILTIPR